MDGRHPGTSRGTEAGLQADSPCASSSPLPPPRGRITERGVALPTSGRLAPPANIVRDHHDLETEVGLLGEVQAALAATA
jgi:hypothetical protein